MSRFRFPSQQHPRAERRVEDLELLKALVKASIDETGAHVGVIPESTIDAFANMHEQIEANDHKVLTDKQREWAEREAHELGLSWGDPAKRNANVPRGREVAMAEVLQRRPKLPPGRKS